MTRLATAVLVAGLTFPLGAPLHATAPPATPQQRAAALKDLSVKLRRFADLIERQHLEGRIVLPTVPDGDPRAKAIRSLKHFGIVVSLRTAATAANAMADNPDGVRTSQIARLLGGGGQCSWSTFLCDCDPSGGYNCTEGGSGGFNCSTLYSIAETLSAIAMGVCGLDPTLDACQVANLTAAASWATYAISCIF